MQHHTAGSPADLLPFHQPSQHPCLLQVLHHSLSCFKDTAVPKSLGITVCRQCKKPCSTRSVTQRGCLKHAAVPKGLKHHGLQAVQGACLKTRTTALAE